MLNLIFETMDKTFCNDLYKYLWFFAKRTDDEEKEFEKRINEFFAKTNDKTLSIILMIFEIVQIKEIHKDQIVTEDGLLYIKDDKYSYADQTIWNDAGVLRWIENLNEWALNLNDFNHSTITTLNDWKDEESLDEYALRRFGLIIFDGIYHNDKFIVNVNKEISENPNMIDAWNMDDEYYEIDTRDKIIYAPIMKN